jgi:hypothetical protein
MNIAKYLSLMVIVAFLGGFSDGKKTSALLEPSYAPLESGEGSFSGMVYDESIVSEVKDISFFGHTTVGGIRKESDDSMNRLEISKIKEIIVLKRSYDSKRYSDKEFSLVQVVTNDGTTIEDLLVPKHVIICGIEVKTQMERSWFLSKLDKIVMGKPSGVIDKILRREPVSAIAPETSNKESTVEKKTPVNRSQQASQNKSQQDLNNQSSSK